MVTAREKLVKRGEPGFYHCISRVVRRAYLLGEDPFSGKNYDHRKDWVRSRLIRLTRSFAIEVSGYSVMINHTHALLRTCPEFVKTWSDREVAERWLSAYPGAIKQAQSRDAKEMVIEMIINDPERIEELRSRLSSISWFMGNLNEHIAREANLEDGCTGRFWEGRFKSIALLDESAVLAGLTYVDLNPIRAGVAETPEESDYTSAQDRIFARQARDRLSRLKAATEESASAKEKLVRERAELIQAMEEDLQRDTWLSAFGKVMEGKPMHFINIELDEYLELLDWTGRQVHQGKRGKIPSHLADILERLEIESECWIDTVLHFDSLFHRVAGKVRSILRATRLVGQKWLRGKPHAGKIFG